MYVLIPYQGFMKKLFFLAILIAPQFVSADAWTSTVTWNNDGAIECPTSTSHAVTHYGVPTTNVASSTVSWSAGCTTHTYYSSTDYTIAVTWNNGWITTCAAWERAIAISPAACTAGACTMTCRRYDDARPVIADVSNPGTNLLAINSRNFSFTVGTAGGSPIVSTSAFFENYASPPTWFLAVQTVANGNWSFNENIQSVDWVDRQANGGRPYTLRVSKICDEAQNCTCWAAYCATPATAAINTDSIRDITYTVYANPNITNVSSNTQDSSALAGAIADGVGRSLVHTIQDAYSNDIIPATGITRTVSQNLSSITNAMYLNQAARNWGSSVYVTPTTGANTALATASPQNLWNQSSTTGAYPLALQVYTPTANSYIAGKPVSDPNAQFGFTSNLVVADPVLGANQTFSQTLSNPSFGPLYTSAFSGDLRDGGFIEWALQNNNITLTNNNVSVTPTSTQLQLAFSGTDSWNFALLGDSSTNPTTTITSTRAAMVVNPMSPLPNPTTTSTLTTFLQQQANAVANLSNLFLSTHFAYTLDAHNVVYNSDVIGRSSFYNTATTNSGSQYGMKVIGAVASNVSHSLTSGQFTTSTSLFSGVDRTTIRNTMNKSIALATRNMKFSNVGLTITGASALPGTAPLTISWGIINSDSNTSIMKLVRTTGTNVITLGNGTDFSILGKRTIVVVWANLYIKSNMYYTGNSSILWVVIQKDANGNGGNLYIDPSITNLVGTYVIDGSVQSYDGTSVLGVSSISTLKNQLYLYGSFISENTIGGSRMSTPTCPRILTIASCNLSMAQQYDLNYLRRYYLYNNTPFGSGLVIGGGTTCNPSTGVCSGFDGNLTQKFSNTITDDLAKYPFIIEQNPATRSNPPPGFDNIN